MELFRLHSTDFEQYISRLDHILENYRRNQSKLLTESTKITIEVDDGSIKLNPEQKKEFVESAEQLGKFDDPEWVNQLLNGLKQAGIQGFNKISEDDRPVTRKEMHYIMEALCKLLNVKQ